MVSLRYRESQGDHTLFLKHSLVGKLTVLLVYVDNFFIFGDDLVEKQLLKEKLVAEFEIKDLRRLKYFLDIEVARHLYFSNYILDFLKETRKLGCKVTGVP